MKRLIERRLSQTRLPADPIDAALAGLPDGIAEAWFERPLIPAAVLIPLIERPEGLQILLTRRTEHLKDHPGQISFPGGRSEPLDRGLLHTALRETREEIGLPAESIRILGYLEPLAVITGFAVAPIVGLVAGEPRFTIDEFEVAEIFEVPLDYFLDEANLVLRERTFKERQMTFSEYHYADRRIWGATAMMITRFINLINNNEARVVRE